MVPTLCTGELNDSNTHVVITLKQHVETAAWSTAVACINGIRTDFNLSLPSALTLLILALLTLRLFLCLHHLFLPEITCSYFTAVWQTASFFTLSSLTLFNPVRILLAEWQISLRLPVAGYHCKTEGSLQTFCAQFWIWDFLAHAALT